MITEHLEKLLSEYQIEVLGTAYDDLIIMRDKLEGFLSELNALGILVRFVSWWCYVNPKTAADSGCPHGMGGPRATYAEGWFSELQNDGYMVDAHTIDRLMFRYDRQTVQKVNKQTLQGIDELLRKPFRYTSAEYIKGNDCVTPSLWLHVPKDWRRNEILD